MLKLRATLVLAALLPASAFLATASPAAAATCTGTPHDAEMPSNDNNNEIDVSCDTAIVNGSITVRINRGGNIVAGATITGGTGSMSCNGQNQPPGSQFDLVIACSGSMTAGATAQITGSLGPNPCSSPPFAGDVSAAFGDGTTFGPSPLAEYDCSNQPGGPHGGGPKPGHNFDPGGVFQGVPKKPVSKASVAEARKGLKFTMKLGVKGKVFVYIEVKGKRVGRTKTSANNGPTHLKAKLGRAAAGKLKGHSKKAKIHVHVVPGKSEGLDSTGEKYFKLKLTG